MEILEMKNISKSKNSWGRLNSRFKRVENRNSKLEKGFIENIQTKAQREVKKYKKRKK